MNNLKSKLILKKIRVFFLIFISIITHSMAIFIILNRTFPFYLPFSKKDFAITIVDDSGAPLRSFPDKNGVWRYPVNPDKVSPLYIQALINYEDRFFRYHPGVNPVALLRAVFQRIKYGRFVSGGSTLTMQVARILKPHKKTIAGKLHQILRALQLEQKFTKDEILNFYLNYAPFGGPVEGVEAASFVYLGKSAKELSHAQAALLAVLPQSPTRLRPDLHPESAEKARNKILDRMVKLGVWDKDTVRQAKMEKVIANFEAHPMKAPLLARRLKSFARPLTPVKTFIDPFIQESVREIIKGFISEAPERTSAAALIVENKGLKVRAYIGSADFLDETRFGHVDMIRAIRSPGSTLKPFLYAMAIEEGLIHSQSLLVDAPFSFKGYNPENFTRHFSGPVSAAEALRRSLNLPAVDLLDRLGPSYFDARLRQGGLNLKFPSHEKPNLSMILGGVGTSLEALVSAYTAFARRGISGKLRYTKDDPIKERRLLDPGPAYIIRKILEETPRTDIPSGRLFVNRSRQVAWKTGTSYGLRDAWTIGVTDNYTIGVWVGRPDGTPSPGQYGRVTAAPVLFAIVDSLPRMRGTKPPVPKSVSRKEICWPLGISPNGENDPLCHERRMAWIFDKVIPPTLSDRTDKLWQPNPITILVNPRTGLHVDPDCPLKNPVKKLIARWPKATWPWLSPGLRKKTRIPPLDPICKKPASTRPEAIRITGLKPGTILRPAGSDTMLPGINLTAEGGIKTLYWLLNGNLIAICHPGKSAYYKFTCPGKYRLTVMDLSGNYDFVEFTVMAGRTREP